MSFRSAFSFCCVCAVFTQVVAKTPLPDVGNWKWVTDAQVQSAGLDSTARGAKRLDAEIGRLKEDFERRLKKALREECQYSTYENLGHVGTISIQLTATPEKEFEGEGGGRAYTSGSETDAAGPDGLPYRKRATSPSELAYIEMPSTNVKVKFGNLKVSGVTALVLDEKGIAIDSIVLSDGKQREHSRIAEYLVSAMASLHSRQRLK